MCITYLSTENYTVKEYRGLVTIFSSDGLEKQLDSEEGNFFIKKIHDTRASHLSTVKGLYSALDELVEEYI